MRFKEINSFLIIIYKKKMVSLVQKKKDALKAKIYALHIEAHTKNLNTFRSDMAIHKKIDKGSVATCKRF